MAEYSSNDTYFSFLQKDVPTPIIDAAVSELTTRPLFQRMTPEIWGILQDTKPNLADFIKIVSNALAPDDLVRSEEVAGALLSLCQVLNNASIAEGLEGLFALPADLTDLPIGEIGDDALSLPPAA